VLVRLEAAPVNPFRPRPAVRGRRHDPGRRLGHARAAGRHGADRGRRDEGHGAAGRRLDAVGNEGAGVVVAAGSSPTAQALLGKTVAVLGGAMYAQYRALPAEQCLLLPAGATPADGASCFVNPLTALGMVETMRARATAPGAHRGRLEPRPDAQPASASPTA
jgi:NADPH2:quinone reductase